MWIPATFLFTPGILGTWQEKVDYRQLITAKHCGPCTDLMPSGFWHSHLWTEVSWIHHSVEMCLSLVGLWKKIKQNCTHFTVNYVKIFDFVLINYIDVKNTCKNKPLIHSSSSIMVVIAIWDLLQFHSGESDFQKNRPKRKIWKGKLNCIHLKNHPMQTI